MVSTDRTELNFSTHALAKYMASKKYNLIMSEYGEEVAKKSCLDYLKQFKIQYDNIVDKNNTNISTLINYTNSNTYNLILSERGFESAKTIDIDKHITYENILDFNLSHNEFDNYNNAFNIAEKYYKEGYRFNLIKAERDIILPTDSDQTPYHANASIPSHLIQFGNVYNEVVAPYLLKLKEDYPAIEQKIENYPNKLWTTNAGKEILKTALELEQSDKLNQFISEHAIEFEKPLEKKIGFFRRLFNKNSINNNNNLTK